MRPDEILADAREGELMAEIKQLTNRLERMTIACESADEINVALQHTNRRITDENTRLTEIVVTALACLTVVKRPVFIHLNQPRNHA